MFCIKCGKTAKIDNFCEDCFLQKEKLFEAKDLELRFCEHCGIKQEAIKEYVEDRVKSENELEKIKTDLKIVGNKVYTKITCTGKIKGVPKEETKKILVVLRKKTCDMHVKLFGGYYEAVIQARGPEKEKIMEQVRKLVPQKALVSIESLKEGYNIKIMRKANAGKAAKALAKNYKIRKTFKLAAEKKGQKLYRNYYAIR